MRTAMNGARIEVYPRWRGEHKKEEILTYMIRGLSPLARGTLRLISVCIFTRRFIPAGAGNTKFYRC